MEAISVFCEVANLWWPLRAPSLPGRVFLDVEVSACRGYGSGDGERNVCPFLPPPNLPDSVEVFENAEGGDEDWRDAVTWEAFFEPLIEPSLDDFFGLFSGGGESEADSEVEAELRR